MLYYENCAMRKILNSTNKTRGLFPFQLMQNHAITPTLKNYIKCI